MNLNLFLSLFILIILTISKAGNPLSLFIARSPEIGFAQADAVEIVSIAPKKVRVTQELVITCRNLPSDIKEDYEVLFTSSDERKAQGRIISANKERGEIKVLTPFGAASGKIQISFQGRIAVESSSASSPEIFRSISGYVYSEEGMALPDVMVKTAQGDTVLTNQYGIFDLPVENYPDQIVTLEIDLGVSALQANLAAQPEMSRRGGQTTKVSAPNGRNTTTIVGSPSGQIRSAQIRGMLGVKENEAGRIVSPSANLMLQKDGVILEIPDTQPQPFEIVNFKNQFTPLKLPLGHFSSLIPIIMPFNIEIKGGGKLSFPNVDLIPTNKRVKLLRLEQDINSPSLGEFVVDSDVQFSADGTRLETAERAVKKSGMYFVSPEDKWSLGTITGSVLFSDGRPVRHAFVLARGQQVITDLDGEFFLPNVPVSPGETQKDANVTVEVIYLEPELNVPVLNAKSYRIQKNNVLVRAGKTTRIDAPVVITPDLPNRAPVILGPTELTITRGDDNEQTFRFIALDYDEPPANRVVTAISDAPEITTRVAALGNDLYGLTLTGLNNPLKNAYSITLSLTDSKGLKTEEKIAINIVNPVSSIIAKNQALTLNEDTSAALILQARNPQNAVLDFQIVEPPTNGGVTATATVGSYTYAPNANFNGNDKITFRVCAGDTWSNQCRAGQQSNVATVAIAVMPINDLPEIKFEPAINEKFLTIPIGETRTFDIIATDPDAEQTLRINAQNALTRKERAKVQTLGKNHWRFTWTPVAEETGQQIWKLAVQDNGLPTMPPVEQEIKFQVNGRLDKVYGPEPPPPDSIDSGGGGHVGALIQYKGRLFAGTNAGIWESKEKGVWVKQAIKDTNDEEYISIVINSFIEANGKLYAGSKTGVFEYQENVPTPFWRSKSDGIDNQGKEVEVLDFAITKDELLAATSSGLFRKPFQQDTWNKPLDLPNCDQSGGINTQICKGLVSLAVKTTSENTEMLFVGVFNGMFRSSDKGKTWQSIPQGLFTASNTKINRLKVIGTRILAATDKGIFFSDNDGNNWIRSVTPPIGVITATSLTLAQNTGTLFAGLDGGVLPLITSTDNGASWQSYNTTICGTPGLGGFSVLIDQVMHDVYVGTNTNGLFVIPSPASRWVGFSTSLQRDEDLKNFPILSLVIYDNQLIAATAERRVSFSPLHTANWQSKADGLPNSPVRALWAQGETALYAGVDQSGVYRWNRQTWDRVGNEFLSGAPTSRALVYALRTKDNLLFAATGNGIYRFDTTNAARGWIQVSADPAYSLLVTENRIYAGGTDKVIWSTGAGDLWTNLPLSVRGEVRSLLQGNTIYAGVVANRVADNGVYSLVGESSWKFHGKAFPQEAQVYSLIDADGLIGAGTLSGFYFTNMAEGDWTQMNGGIFSLACFTGEGIDLNKKTDMRIFSLVRTGDRVGATVYAGTASGVFTLQGTLTNERSLSTRRATQRGESDK